MAALVGRRSARSPAERTGGEEASYPVKQNNRYAMGRRALTNADSYARLVLTANGAPATR